VTGDAAATAPVRWRQAVIERIAPQTPRISSVFMRVPLGPYLAGQHVDVRLTAPDGYQAQRSYSIASAPGSNVLELAIERLDDGEISPYFHDVAQPGDTIEVRGPIGGHFIWRAQDGGPILLVAGGSGIVPLMAMARHRAAAAPGTKALLVYSARTWEDLAFRDELSALATVDAEFGLVITTTRGPKHRAQDFERRVDRKMLRDVWTDQSSAARVVYVCGSNSFVESVTTNLVLEDVAPGCIRTERYGGEQ
jgi:ferredoxin-NADP reductase